jgi:hypothetical protein
MSVMDTARTDWKCACKFSRSTVSWGIFPRHARPEWHQYAVALSADHGGMDIPERLREKGNHQRGSRRCGLAAAEVGKLLAPRFDRTESVLKGLGIGGDIWSMLAYRRTEGCRDPGSEGALCAHPQVYAAFTRTEIMAVPMPTARPTNGASSAHPRLVDRRAR